MHTIVSTIGTSAIEKFLKPDLQNGEDNPLHLTEVDLTALEDLQDDIFEQYNPARLRRSREEEPASGLKKDKYRFLVDRYIEESPAQSPVGNEDSWRKEDWFMMPAEAASILRISEHLGEEDYLERPLLLLETDTEESHISAEITEKLLEKYGFRNVKRQTVKGFQMEDVTLFNDKGIESFMDAVDTVKKESEEMVLNVTGGYKSFIPFASSVASFNKVDMYYIHETAVPQKNSLVKIPYVPMFNSAMAEEKNVVINTVKKVERDASLTSRSDARQMINLKLKRELDGHTNFKAYTNFVLSFFDFSDNQVTFSPLGRIYFRYLLKGSRK